MTREEMIAKLQENDKATMIAKLQRDDEVSKMKSGRDVETGLKTAADEFTLGYTPQLVGAFKAATSDTPYVEARDEYAKELAMLKKANPVAAGIGTVGGIAGGLLVPAGAIGMAGKLGLKVGRGAKALVQGGKALSVAQRAGQAAKTGAKVGALYGLLQNPGDVEGEVSPIQPVERLVGAGTGAAAGSVLGGGMSLAGDGASKLGQLLRKKSQEQAFSSLGPRQATSTKYGQKGQDLKIGQAALDEGVIGKLPRGKEKLLERAEQKLEEAGRQIGDNIDELSKIESVLKEQGQNVGIDKKAIAAKLSELIDPSESGDPKFNKFVKNQIDFFLEAGEGRPLLDIATAHKQKANIGKNNINWMRVKKGEATSKDKYFLKLREILSDAELDSADVIAKSGGNESLRKAISSARDKYAKLAPMREILQKSTAAQKSNRGLSLTDTIATSGGLIGGGAAGGLEGAALGLLLGGGHRLGRLYGTQAMAQGFGAGAGLLQKGSSKLQKGAAGLLPGYLGARSIRGEANER